MPWFEVVERFGNYTFRIYTDSAMGTGFLVMVGSAMGHIAALATAWHVVKKAETGTSLRICNRNDNEVARSLGGNMAVMEVENGLDSALVVIKTKAEIFPQDLLLPQLPADVGWMSYPGTVEPELCFFHSHIAGTLKKPPIYFVDGVATNGVSGGPVFDDQRHLTGLVSARR